MLYSIRDASAKLRRKPSARHGLRLPAVNTARAESSISLKNLKVSLGKPGSKRPVLNGVNLEVSRGSLHMLLGPNGCGKSTLLKVLGGLIRPDSGSLRADGPCGFVFQNPDHQVVMPTVAADVAFGLGRYKLSEAKVRESVSAALRLVNLEDYIFRATHTLSGGQKQRVAIAGVVNAEVRAIAPNGRTIWFTAFFFAGALAEDPKVLLLDELTTFLDIKDQFGVLEAVRSVTHSKKDVTAVWVTHRFEELQYADTASYLENGRIVFSGSPKEMLKHLESLGAHL